MPIIKSKILTKMKYQEQPIVHAQNLIMYGFIGIK